MAAPWACPACTLVNPPSSAMCVVCNGPRPPQPVLSPAAFVGSSGGGGGGGSGGGGGGGGAASAAAVAAIRTLADVRAFPAFAALLRVPPISKRRCGAPLHTLFAFFDQMHTTGTHMDLAPTAQGIITMGATTNYRDFAQGAWRLRKLESGQALEVVWPADMAANARKALGGGRGGMGFRGEKMANPGVPLSAGDLVAFLLLQSLRQEARQAATLAEQRLSHVHRYFGLHRLQRAEAEGLVWRPGFDVRQVFENGVKEAAAQAARAIKQGAAGQGSGIGGGGGGGGGGAAGAAGAAAESLARLLAPPKTRLTAKDAEAAYKQEGTRAFLETHDYSFAEELKLPLTVEEELRRRLQSFPRLLSCAMGRDALALELAMAVAKALPACSASGGGRVPAEAVMQMAALNHQGQAQQGQQALQAQQAQQGQQGLAEQQQESASVSVSVAEDQRQRVIQGPRADPARTEFLTYGLKALLEGALRPAASGEVKTEGGKPVGRRLSDFTLALAPAAAAGKKGGGAAGGRRVKLPSHPALCASDAWLHGTEPNPPLPDYLPAARIMLTVSVEAAVGGGGVGRAQQAGAAASASAAAPPTSGAAPSGVGERRVLMRKKCAVCTIANEPGAVKCIVCDQESFEPGLKPIYEGGVWVEDDAAPVPVPPAAAVAAARPFVGGGGGGGGGNGSGSSSAAALPGHCTWGFLVSLREGEALRAALWRINDLPRGSALRTQLLPSAQAMHVDLWLLGPERQEMDARQRLGGCCVLGSQGATGSAAGGGGGGGGASGGAALGHHSAGVRDGILALAAHARFFDVCSGAHKEEVDALLSEGAFSAFSPAERQGVYKALNPLHRYRSPRGAANHPALCVRSGEEWHALLATLSQLLQGVRGERAAHLHQQQRQQHQPPSPTGSVAEVFLYLCTGSARAIGALGGLPPEVTSGKLGMEELLRKCEALLGARARENVKALCQYLHLSMLTSLNWENFNALFKWA